MGGGLAKKKNNPVREIVVTDSDEADEADEMSLMSAAECKLESPAVGGGVKKKNTPRRERDFLSLGSLACKFPLNSIEDVEHILELIKQPDRLEELVIIVFIDLLSLCCRLIVGHLTLCSKTTRSRCLSQKKCARHCSCPISETVLWRIIR